MRCPRNLFDAELDDETIGRAHKLFLCFFLNIISEEILFWKCGQPLRSSVFDFANLEFCFCHPDPFFTQQNGANVFKMIAFPCSRTIHRAARWDDRGPAPEIRHHWACMSSFWVVRLHENDITITRSLNFFFPLTWIVPSFSFVDVSPRARGQRGNAIFFQKKKNYTVAHIFVFLPCSTL